MAPTREEITRVMNTVLPETFLLYFSGLFTFLRCAKLIQYFSEETIFSSSSLGGLGAAVFIFLSIYLFIYIYLLPIYHLIKDWEAFQTFIKHRFSDVSSQLI